MPSRKEYEYRQLHVDGRPSTGMHDKLLAALQERAHEKQQDDDDNIPRATNLSPGG